MNQITIKVIKQTFKMDDGNLISGVQVVIAPMVYKFISLNQQKLDLLSEIRPDFYQWFVNSSDNSELILFEPNLSSAKISPIYSTSENSL